MTKFSIFALCCLCLFSGCSSGRAESEPDASGDIGEREAIRIAEKAFVEKYGESVLRQKPWKAEKIGDRYYVCGTLPRYRVVAGYVSAMNGEVMQIWHGK